MREKDLRIQLRVSKEEYIAIKLAAAENNVTLTEYVKQNCLPCKNLSDVFNADIVEALIRLRGDIGKATGMLKQAISSDQYNPKIFSKILKQYIDLKKQLEDLMSDCSNKLRNL